MSSTPLILLDIDEIIVGLLADSDDENHLAVKTCSLVSRTFLPLCRKYIFASIALNHRISPTTRQLERLLSKSPEIGGYIRHLDYIILGYDLTSPSIQEFLKRFSRLQSLSIGHFSAEEIDWSSNPLRPGLLHLLHLPTLTHFKLERIKNFVTSDLIPCVNLKKLEIDDFTTGAATNTFPETLPDRSIQLNEFVAGFRSNTTIMNICTAQRPDGQPIIDFSSLAKLTITFNLIQKNSDIEVPQVLFRHCKQLTDVDISIYNSEWFCPRLSKMLWPSMQTLTHLNITASVFCLDDDSVVGIPSELEDMRNNNIIEKIIIEVSVATDVCRHDDDWGRLDEVLTRPGWSVLEHVSLTISIRTQRTSGSRLGVALQNLPETQFPGLSRSKSVSFKFEVRVCHGMNWYSILSTWNKKFEESP